MEFLFYFSIFILGLAVGSFLNVVVDRTNQGKSFLKGRSQCDICKHKLAWLDLIPVFSFLSLNGRCRYCGRSFSWYHPITEIVTGLAFVLVIFSIFGNDVFFGVSDARYLLASGYFLLILSSLIVIFFSDLKYGIIPFVAVFPAILVAFLWYIFLPVFHFKPDEIGLVLLNQNYLLNYLVSGLITFLFFFLLFVLTKGKGMGFGDVVYAFLMGFILGFPKIILSLYFAFLSGAFISILLVLIHKKKLRGSTIPFGPFLVLGTVISLFWGDRIIHTILAFIS